MAGAALVALLATRPPQTATEVDTPLVGQSAPSITGPDARRAVRSICRHGGAAGSSSTSSPAGAPRASRSKPELVAFAYAHRSPGSAALVGVVFDDSASTARSFMRSTGATWPAVVDSGGQIALDYGVRGPPETFIVAPDGTVVAHFDGPMTNASLDYWLNRAQGSPR